MEQLPWSGSLFWVFGRPGPQTVFLWHQRSDTSADAAARQFIVVDIVIGLHFSFLFRRAGDQRGELAASQSSRILRLSTHMIR